MLNKILCVILLTVIVSCRKGDDFVPVMPAVEMIAAYSINQTSALARGNLAAEGSLAEEYGIEWGHIPQPTGYENRKSLSYSAGINTFSIQLDNLELGQTYYVRAYVQNGSETIYSEPIAFTHQGPFVWMQLNDVSWPDKQHTVSSTTSNGSIFVIRPISQTDTEMWLFTPFNNSWTQQPNLNIPSARYAPLFITLNKFGGDATFIAGGYVINEHVPERYVYLRDCFGFSLFGNMKISDNFDYPFGNALLTHFVIDNRAYALSIDEKRDFAEFENGVIWNKKNSFSGVFLGNYVSFSIGNKGYVLAESTTNAYPTKDFYAYDPESDSWTKKADFPGKDRIHGIAFSVGGKGYYGAGEAKDIISGLRDIWQYDPELDTWKKFTDFPGTGNVRMIANTVADKVYMGLGFGLNISTTGAELYSRAFDYWEFAP